ncbi:MAG: 50S ribosomal protein L22 [Acidobacteria bacterium ADurb.Bin340]|jgi:large subunit ribosomal protein L22|nr:MAG: 50S ribosomal protein L22 [Acidobacteria bacterium ADurb.Bin340]HOD32348.1 50S ribosomal protein L22 [Holophaga sp.]HQL48119.1 50S ribosomal protein L22 [Holophaga sp.]
MSEIVSTATIRHLRGSAQKARLVVDLIRGRRVGEAQWILASTKKYASEHIKKLLDSAVANAIDKNPAVNPDELMVAKAYVDEGFRMKRVRPAPMGRAYRVQKRTCHITLELGREE